MSFLLYRDTQGYYRWTLFAANNRKIANSGEGYNNRTDCLAAINLVKGSGSAGNYALDLAEYIYDTEVIGEHR